MKAVETTLIGTTGAASYRPATLGALLCAALLLWLGAWIYWPGISGPELLDDRSSVLVIGDLKKRPELALDYIVGDKSGALGRSVSMTSFVLEKMYLDEGIVGNKKVNIALHLLNGALLIWLFWLLLRFIEVPGYRALAVLLGALWILHPLLVSTVLYVVQRMAILATLFMLLASISYVYWRLRLIRGSASVLHFMPVPLFFAVALLAKENAVVLVPTLLLLEVWWFECRGQRGEVIHWLQRTSYSLIASGAVVLAMFALLRWEHLAERFHSRPFSLTERLLTQSRVVWDYVSQSFHPQVARMGIYHDDVVVSSSLFTPLSTLFAVLAWLLVIVFGAVLIRSRGGRWIAFGIAWFLLGHSVESTVLPLEMYFEHRSYFPLMGLLLAVGGLFAVVVRRWPEPKAPLLACLGLCALLLSGLTSSQVQVWSNRTLLVLNHLNGHPESARANIDMATELAQIGEIEAAHRYSRLALEASANKSGSQERKGDYQVRNLALSCIAGKPVSPLLIETLGADDPQRPLRSVTTLLTLVRLLQDDKCPQFDRVRFADRMAQLYLVKDFERKATSNIYSNLAVLENALHRYDNAYAYAQQLLVMKPYDKRGLLMKLHFATALGNADAAREVIATLQQMDEQGKLTTGEQQTLALYVHN